MDQQIFVYVDLDNTPHLVGRLWLHVRKRVESATFRYDEEWLRNPVRFAGIRTWNELGRFVKKGQKGIPILAPMIGTKRQQRDQPQETGEQPAPLLIGFRKVFVLNDYLMICGRDFARSIGRASRCSERTAR